MTTNVSIEEQVAMRMRGADFGDAQTYANMEKELRARLLESQQSGRPLKVYLGVDPSAPDIHLGHSVPMRKLRQFQELGHECTFLIGNFTSLIGDASDKEGVRKQLTPEPVSYTHLRAHETVLDLVCRLLLEKKQRRLHVPLTWYFKHDIYS